MTDAPFNIVKGALAEKFRNFPAAGIVLLLTANEAEAALIDHDNLSVLLAAAGNTEATFAGYARKTGLTGTITVDDVNERVDLDMPDQTWAAATAGNSLKKAVFAIEEAAADTTRIPGTHQDFVVTTDGSDVTIQLNASGFYRAA